jgi:hypothetical protein
MEKRDLVLFLFHSFEGFMSTLIPALPTGGRPLPTKVVVRLLPPSLSEEEFKKAIPETFFSEVDHMKFFQGTYHDTPFVESPNVNGRCYVNFKTFKTASEFVQKLHGQSFEDPQDGQAYRCVATIAPFQRIARPWKSLKNLIENQIETEDHYKAFCESPATSGGSFMPTYTFDKEKSESFVSPLVKSLSEQNEKMNEILKRNRERQKRSKKVAEPQEEIKPISVKGNAKKKKGPKKKITIVKREGGGDGWN